MADFVKGGGTGTPFGRNEFLRSTNPKFQTESYTVARSTVPARTIDGYEWQRILQPGTVMAKITSGEEIGKIGPFQAAGTRETQTLTKAGTVSGGTFTLAFGTDVTTAIAWDAVAADVEAALNALSSIELLGGVAVTGGPIASTAFTVTFVNGGDQPLLVSDVTLLTGAGAGVTVAEGTTGVAGANDGRQTLANIVGLDLTFLPWTLFERDVEVSVVTNCTAVQAWCIELDASGAEIALTNTTADAMRSVKRLDINFS